VSGIKNFLNFISSPVTMSSQTAAEMKAVLEARRAARARQEEEDRKMAEELQRIEDEERRQAEEMRKREEERRRKAEEEAKRVAEEEEAKRREESLERYANSLVPCTPQEMADILALMGRRLAGTSMAGPSGTGPGYLGTGTCWPCKKAQMVCTWSP
jgi:hypothetical protein